MRKILITVLFALSLGHAVAQDLIKGIVKDETSQPMPGATIFIKGTTNATVSDGEGRFSIHAPKDFPFTVTISLVGYKTQDIEIYEILEEDIEVSLKLDNVLNEIVVVGYGTQKREDFTGSVASVPTDLKLQPVSSPERLLQGAISGVQVIPVQRTTGRAGGSIRVRGGTSITAGNEPLYVIDGFPVYNSETGADAGVTSGPKINPMSFFNPSDIESIDVLKDASATAIYGSRGANGVIIITTKKGKHNTSTLNYDGYYGVQNVLRKVPLLNAEQWGELKNDALTDSGKPALYSDDQLAQLGKGTDWQDEAFHSAAIQNHSLSFLTGTEKSTLAISGNYFKQDGIIRFTGFDRYSGRVNLEHEFNDRLKLTAFITGSTTRADVAPDGLVPAILQMPPVIPVRDGNGNFTVQNTYGTAVGNPINTLYNQINKTITNRFLMNGSGEYRIIDGLTAKVLIGADLINNKQNRYLPSTVYEGRPGGFASVGSLSTTNWLNENTLTYKKVFGEHALEILVGNTQQQSITESFAASSSNFVNDLLSYNDLKSGAVLGQPQSYYQKWVLQSYLGRANYALKDRYFLTLTVRSDGSSRFGAANKWGTFPSAAIAWNVSREDFMKSIPQISLLKFRFSAGLTGNQEIDPYKSIARLTYLRYNFANTLVAGFAPSTHGNANLGWEKTTQYDFGVDIGVLDNRINLVTDIYYKRTNALLLEVPVPYTTGIESEFQNLGSIENKGIELSINTQNFTGKFQWTTSFIFSANRNKVLSLGPGVDNFIPIDPSNTPRPSGIVQVGQPLGSFYMYKTNGVFQSGDDFSLSPLAKTEPGSQKYLDVNGDGHITQAGDRTIVGNSQPKFLASITNTFRYRNFDLTIFFQSSYGNKIFNNTRAELETGSGFIGAYGTLLNRWTPANTNTDMHRAVEDPSPTLSDRFVEDGSYLRLKNLTFGYTLPQAIAAKARLSKVRIYITGQNLLTWTNYTGFDPEVSRNGQSALNSGIDNGVYPNSKSILGGLSLSF